MMDRTGKIFLSGTVVQTIKVFCDNFVKALL